MSRIQGLVAELKRRRVFRVAATYAVVAFVIWQVAEIAVPGLRLPDWVLTLVIVLTLLGFPIAIALAWAFDLTPAGVQRAESPPPVSARRASGLIGDVIGKESIVVLPFDNLSPDPQDAYFADGLTEEIIADLSCCGLMRVVSRTSATALKRTQKDARTIARDFDVQYVLEGSVRKAGNDLRITAQLIDARADEHLWAQRYNGRLEHVLDMQEEVSRSIVDALKMQLGAGQEGRTAELTSGGESDTGTRDVEAYDLYLKGRYLWNQRTESGLRSSLEYYAEALARDARFASAHAGLADSYVTLGVYGASPPEKVMPAAKAAASEALRIDPGHARALTARACVRAVYDWDWAAAEAEFKQALESDPQYPTAHQWYANNVLIPLRRFDEAERALERAARLEPLSPAVSASRGALAYYRRDYEHAMENLDGARKLHPHFGLIHYFSGRCLLAQGRYEEALRASRSAVELTSESSETLAALGHCLSVSGNRAEAVEVLARLEERAGRGYVSPVLLAQVSVGLGETGAALEKLEEAVRLRACDLIWLAVLPVFDPLRTDPRFVELTRKVGLV